MGIAQIISSVEFCHVIPSSILSTVVQSFSALGCSFT